MTLQISNEIALDLDNEVGELRAEIARLTAERDEWQAKWVALAQAALVMAGADDHAVLGPNAKIAPPESDASI